MLSVVFKHGEKFFSSWQILILYKLRRGHLEWNPFSTSHVGYNDPDIFWKIISYSELWFHRPKGNITQGGDGFWGRWWLGARVRGPSKVSPWDGEPLQVCSWGLLFSRDFAFQKALRIFLTLYFVYAPLFWIYAISFTNGFPKYMSLLGNNERILVEPAGRYRKHCGKFCNERKLLILKQNVSTQYFKVRLWNTGHKSLYP